MSQSQPTLPKEADADLFRLLVANVTDYAIFLLDQQGNIATWNPGAERIKGYKADEIIGQHFSKFYPQEAIDRGWPSHELRVAREQGRFEDEGWRVRQDGTQFWANVVITALKDEQGNLIGFSKITRDLTERKRSEENARRLVEEMTARRVAEEASQLIQEQRERLHVTLASIGDAVISTDAEGRVDFLNPVAQQLVGWQVEEAVGRPLPEVFLIVNEETRQSVENPALRALRDGRVVGLANHTVLISKAGIERPIDDSASPIRDSQGNVVGSVLVFRDISERKRRERQFREQQELLRVTLASIGDAVIATDTQGRVSFLNGVAEDLTGWRNDEARGQSLESVFPILNEQTRLPVENPVEKVLRTGAIVGLGNHTVLIAKDGTERPIDDSAAPIRDEAGHLYGVVLTFRDVTEHRRAEAALRQSESETRRLLAFHEAVVANMGEGLYAVDTQGLVTYMNPAAEKYFGWKRSDLLGRRMHDMTHYKHPDGNPFPIEECAGFGVLHERTALHNYDDTFIRKDGTFFPVTYSSTPLILEGMVSGIVVVFRDMTEKRRTDQEIRASEARKSAILEAALDCIITMDHEGNVVEFNPAAERTFGLKREETIGQELCQLIIPPNLRDSHRRGMAHYLATGEGPVLGKRLELPAMRSDGSEFPVELSITRISSAGPPLFTAYLRDITKQKRAEQLRNVRLAATHVLSGATGIEEGAKGLLATVGDQLGWQVGFFWTVDESGEALICRQSWHSTDAPPSDFEAVSCSRTFAKDEGLPGRVWSSGQPTWILDVRREVNFPRAPFAAQDGLQSAFASPILFGEQTIGVIEFFNHRIREPEADLLETMATIAGHVGQFLERSRVEFNLRQSEARFRGLMEQAPFSVQVFSPDGKTVRVNRAWEELWGVTLDQVADYNILKDRQLEAKGVLPFIMQAFAGTPTHVPAIEYDPNETIPRRTRYQDPRRWVAAVVYPLKDDGGSVREVVIVHDDITSRQKADADLRESERRLRLALEAGRMGVWDWNIRTNEINWSDSLEPMHGLAPGAFEGTFEAYQRLIHPADREKVRSAIQQAIEQGAGYEIEFRNVWPNGSVHWIAGKGMVFAGRDGQPERMIGVGIDITQRKRSEQTARFLADASATLAVLVDFDSTLQKVASLAVPDFADWAAVDLVEADGSLRRVAVAHVDPAKVALAHDVHRRFPPDPAAPQGAWNILRTGEAELVPEISDELLDQSITNDELLKITRELGLKSYIGVPLKVRGKTLGVITFISAESGHSYDTDDLAVAQDLADRGAIAIENTRLYRELREADRRKDEFLATLAHELRNPLAPIRNSLQILKMPRIDAEIVDQTRDMMERQVHHLVRLVDDLLDVSRVMRGKIELRREPVELASVIARAVETAKPLIEVQNHTLEIVVSKESLLLDADPVRLTQVVGNLLMNSAKYSEVDGRIWLTARREGDEAVLSVRDAGIGIAPDMLPHVFELFVQADHASTKSQGGLGIGLTLVKNLVEMHGGTVKAHSSGLSQGSEFIVRLPLMKAKNEQVRPSVEQEQPEVFVSGHRLLVVDDNHDAAMSLSMLLRLQGHEVQVAHDGPTALRAAETFRPALIFLDIGMPGMDGYEVARRIRKTPGLEATVLVALTGWGQQEDRRRTAEVGFDHHLVKPPEPKAVESLLAALRR